MELSVQQYLRNGGTLASLEAQYAVKAKRHRDYPNLVCLKYSQIESPFEEEIVRDCRGIILDEAANWDIACLTFRKFFNHGDNNAAPIDWSTARVEEKADGSLMQLYNYRGKWLIASSGTPDASGNVISSQMEVNKTFADLFWETWKGLGYDVSVLNPEYSYAFELMTPFNKVVVPHREPKLALLGVRHTATGNETHPSLQSYFPTVSTFPLQSWDECVEAAKHVDPSVQEGYVVVDAQWNRVKMKAPAYVALAHMRDAAASPRKVLEVVRMGESTEFLAYFPEWKPYFDEIARRYDGLVAELEGAYARLAHIPPGKAHQKEFALEAVKCRVPGALFALRAGSVSSIKEYLADMLIAHLMKLLSVKDVEVCE